MDPYELDIAGSRIRLADRWFPALLLVWQTNSKPFLSSPRLFGAGRPDNFLIAIPMENGACATVVKDPDPVLNLHLEAPWARGCPDDLLWEGEPTPLWSDGRSIRHHDGWFNVPRDSEYIWQDCEADWLAEHIDRLSRLPVIFNRDHGRWTRLHYVRLADATDLDLRFFT